MSPTRVAEERLQIERTQVDRQHIFAVAGAPDFLDLVRVLFEEERYNVTTTNLALETYEQITATKPDLLIVDLGLGQPPVWELLERLHREAATLGKPVILTATNSKLLEWAQAGVERYGNNRVIVEPFDIDDVVQTVLDLIGPRGAIPAISATYQPRSCIDSQRPSLMHVGWSAARALSA